MKSMAVVNDAGIKFNVVAVQKGDSYGLRNQLTHTEDEVIIRFFDTRYPHTPEGQFVASYYAESLIEGESGHGLSLDNGVPDWQVSAENMREIREWIRSEKLA